MIRPSGTTSRGKQLLKTALFVGGSLLAFGGQNLIEPAALGIPVIVGPHTYNFADATDEDSQVLLQKHNLSGLFRNVDSFRNGDSNVCCVQCRGVVDAVSHQQHPGPLGLQRTQRIEQRIVARRVRLYQVVASPSVVAKSRLNTRSSVSACSVM